MGTSISDMQAWLSRLERLLTPERIVWLLALIIFLVAWNRGLHLLYAMFSFLLSGLLISYVGSWWQLRGITCQVILPKEIYRADTVNAEVTLSAVGTRNLLSVTLEDKDGVLIEKPAYFDEVDGTGSQSMNMSFNLRGLHCIDKIKVTSCFPFGLVQLSKRINMPVVETTVYPKVSPIRQLPEQIILGSQVDGDIPQHQKLGQDEFAMVREYRDGDEMRNIHWRMSAKHNEWVVKEFDSTKIPAFAVVLNTNRNWGSDENFNPREHMIDIVASLAEKCAQSGCGLLVVLAEDEQYMVKPFQRDLQPLMLRLALWEASESIELNKLTKTLQAYPLVVRFSSKNDELPTFPLQSYQHQINLSFDLSSYPNLGVNAGVKVFKKSNETKRVISSSTQTWGLFG